MLSIWDKTDSAPNLPEEKRECRRCIQKTGSIDGDENSKGRSKIVYLMLLQDGYERGPRGPMRLTALTALLI